MFLIRPGSGTPAIRLIVGMRQQDSPAAPVSSTLPQRRISVSTAASVNGEEQNRNLDQRGKVAHTPRNTLSEAIFHVSGELFMSKPISTCTASFCHAPLSRLH